MAQTFKPKQRHLGQQRALARNGLTHHHVESRQAVAGHHQDAVTADRIVVTHLAACEKGQGFDVAFKQGGVHGRGIG